ncbi:MAG: DUF799 domain-containing protein [Bacteroidales bacterium]|nr:DUF799 domain-containing protein [Bacteroidales bacterium]
MKKLTAILFAVVVLAACGTTDNLTREDQYALMYEKKPVSILVMPPINNSSNVEAKELLYTAISRPLAEAGYYVVSPLLAMEILKSESAYDAELFVDSDLKPFNKVFGVDAVLFSEINSWTKQGFGIRTNIRMFIKSAYDGEILFDRSCDLYLNLNMEVSNPDNSLLISLVGLAASAINTAATDHIVAARKANEYILKDLPRGKYHPYYMQDQSFAAEQKDISVTIN